MQGETGEHGELEDARARLWPEDDIVSPPENPLVSITELLLVIDRLRCVLVEPKPSPLLCPPPLDEAVLEPKSMREALLLSVGVCIIGFGLLDGSAYTDMAATVRLARNTLLVSHLYQRQPW